VLNSIFESVIQNSLTLPAALLCTGVSLVLGIGVALVYMTEKRYNKGFVVTLALLPAMVQIVIALVNGNLGAGVAVAGAFTLVRFRSVPGSAREIGSIFFAMAIGLATGMGYLFYAFLFFIIIGAVNIILSKSKFGNENQSMHTLKVTIPENLDYEGLFDDLFGKYTFGAEIDRVKTTNMGSLYEISYLVQLKTAAAPKEFLDELRCRNGNLNIICGRQTTNRDEL